MELRKNSETIASITAALIQVQKYMLEHPIYKDKKGMRNTYASYEQTAAYCQHACVLHDIVMTHTFTVYDGGIFMCLTLLYKNGEFLSSYDYLYPAGEWHWESKSANEEQQTKGAAKTYTGRYQLKHMFCLPIEDEDIDSKKNQTEQRQRTVYISSHKAQQLRALLANTRDPEYCKNIMRSQYNITNIGQLRECYVRNVEQLLTSQQKEG